MGTTAQKLNRILDTKTDLKTVINYAGGNIVDETVFKDYPKKLQKAYIDILNNGTDELYESLPKTTLEATTATLDTEKGKMKINLKPKLIQENVTLPSAYRMVRYITSTGTQYIDLGIKATNNTRILLTLNMSSRASVVMPFGDFTDSTKAFTCNIGSSSSAKSRCGNDVISQNFGTAVNTIYNLDISENGYYINGTNKWTPTENTFTTNDNIHLFIANGSTSGLVGKIYRCQIYENNELIMDLIPCYRDADSKPGMYDLINNDFLTNQGSDEFTYPTSANNFPTVELSSKLKVITGDNIITVNNEEETETQNYSLTLDDLEYNEVNGKKDYFFKNIPDTDDYDENLIDNEWYLKKIIGKHIFSGTSDDSYNYASDSQDVVAVNINPNKTTNSFYKTDVGADGPWILSDKFKYAQNTSNTEHLYITAGVSLGNHEFYGNLRLYIWHTRLIGYSSSLTDSQKVTLLKDWLQANPFTAYYIYRNPKNIHISEEDYPALKAELEDIYNNVKSYDNKTIVTQTNDDLPFVLNISALAKIE